MKAIKAITDSTIKLLERKAARRFAVDIIKIQSQAASIQAEYAGLLERDHQLVAENADLKRRNQELEDLLSVVRKVEFHYEACWVKREDDSLDGPFSPPIWDLDRKLVRMHLSRRGNASFEFVCIKFQKTSTVPLGFMVKHRVWTEEELK